MDFQALLFNPTHDLLGVNAKLVVRGTEYTVRVLDKTSGIDTGETVHGQTILPAAVVRVDKLKKLGLRVTDLGSKSTFLCLSGRWWNVVTYKMRPSPQGEALGEVYLLLERNGAPAGITTLAANDTSRNFNFNALINDVTQGFFGVDAMLQIGNAFYQVRAIDKTSGIDTGAEVQGQTILPAAVVRAKEITSLGLQYADLGTRRSFLKLNGTYYKIITYRMRPSPYGEDDGEIYLLLSACPVADLLFAPGIADLDPILYDAFRITAILDIGYSVTFTDEAVLDAQFSFSPFNPVVFIFDEAALDAGLTIVSAIDLSASLADDTGLTALIGDDLFAALADDQGFDASVNVITDLFALLADDDGLDANPSLPRELFAALVDDLGLAAVIGDDLAAALADDTGLSAAVSIITSLIAALADDTGLAAVIGDDLVAAIADDTGLAATVSVITSLTAAVADDTGLTAVIGDDLVAAIADDTGLASTITVTSSAVDLSATIADDTGLAATVTTNWELSATIADDTGLAATVSVVTSLTATVADDTGLAATASVTSSLTATVADDTGLAATVSVITSLAATVADDTGLAATVSVITSLAATVADDTGLDATMLVTTNLSAATADDTGISTSTMNIQLAPTVRSSNSGSAASGSTFTVAMPATVSAGDLLLIIMSTTSVTPTTPAGWSTLVADKNSTFLQMNVFYKTAVGTEGGTNVTVTAASTPGAWVTYSVQDWQGTPVKGTAVTATTNLPDPPARASVSAGTDNDLWIAVNSSVGGTATVYPTNYSIAQKTIANSTTIAVSAAGRSARLSTDDPSTFTNSSSARTVAQTFAIQGKIN